MSEMKPNEIIAAAEDLVKMMSNGNVSAETAAKILIIAFATIVFESTASDEAAEHVIDCLVTSVKFDMRSMRHPDTIRAN